MQHNHVDRCSFLRPTAWALALLLSACSGGGSGSSLRKAQSTDQSTFAAGGIEIVERFIAYMADEASTGAAGTDFNGDGDTIDAIAAVANVVTGEQRVLDVAATSFEMVRTNASGASLFLVVDEALDAFDWDGDLATDDVVLLHTNVSTVSALAFVSTLGDDRIAAVADRVYFQEDASGLLAGETALMYVTAAAPLAPVRVLNADVASTADEPEILAADEGILFLSFDETNEALDLNGDADQLDTDVLALLDGTDAAAALVEVGLALQDDSTPLRALDTGSTWIVAFLVDEAQQGAANLDDPALFGASWKPPQCVGFEDADAVDQVLHFLDFAAFAADPIGDAPVNTGLVGDDTVLAVQAGNTAFVATVTTEGAEGTCDLNADGDTTDDVLRWTEAVFPPAAILPFTDEGEIQALASVGGATDGVVELGGRFAAVISESDDGQDHNGDADTADDLVAWLDPDDALPAWEFDHSSPGTLPINFVTTGWLDALGEGGDRMGVAFPETSFLTGGNPTDINGDGDTLDSVPTFARFSSNGSELDFPGPGIAVAATNAGIEIGGSQAFYRVDESADERDWNQDGDQTDFVLFRTNVTTLQGTFFVSTLNNFAAPAITPPDPGASAVAVAFLAQEAAQTADFNGDGDTADVVLRWFRVD